MPILTGKFFFHQISKEKSAAYYIWARAIVGQIRYMIYDNKSVLFGFFISCRVAMGRGVQNLFRQDQGQTAVTFVRRGQVLTLIHTSHLTILKGTMKYLLWVHKISSFFVVLSFEYCHLIA